MLQSTGKLVIKGNGNPDRYQEARNKMIAGILELFISSLSRILKKIFSTQSF